MTMGELTAALREQNLSVGVGTGDKSTITVSGNLLEAESLGNILIKARAEGQAIRLKDIAKIDVASGYNTTTKLDGKPCVVLTISRAVDADVAETMKQVQARLAELVKKLPEGIACRVIGQE